MNPISELFFGPLLQPELPPSGMPAAGVSLAAPTFAASLDSARSAHLSPPESGPEALESASDGVVGDAARLMEGFPADVDFAGAEPHLPPALLPGDALPVAPTAGPSVPPGPVDAIRQDTLPSATGITLPVPPTSGGNGLPPLTALAPHRGDVSPGNGSLPLSLEAPAAGGYASPAGVSPGPVRASSGPGMPPSGSGVSGAPVRIDASRDGEGVDVHILQHASRPTDTVRTAAAASHPGRSTAEQPRAPLADAAGRILPSIEGVVRIPSAPATATGLVASEFGHAATLDTATTARAPGPLQPTGSAAAAETAPSPLAERVASSPAVAGDPLQPAAGILRPDAAPTAEASLLSAWLDRRTVLDTVVNQRSGRAGVSPAPQDPDSPLPVAVGESVESRNQTVAARPVVPLLAPRDLGLMAERIETLVHRGMGRALVNINLGELGDVEIRVRMESRQANVQFVVQDAQVREALEAQLPRLRALLAEGGINLGDVAANLQGRGDGGSSRDPASGAYPPGRRPEAEDALEPAPEIRRRGDGGHLLDAFA